MFISQHNLNTVCFTQEVFVDLDEPTNHFSLLCFISHYANILLTSLHTLSRKVFFFLFVCLKGILWLHLKHFYSCNIIEHVGFEVNISYVKLELVGEK